MLASVVLPPKLWYFAGCSLAANAALAATGQPAKLRKIGGARSSRQNSPHFSGFAGGDLSGLGFSNLILWLCTPQGTAAIMDCRTNVVSLLRISVVLQQQTGTWYVVHL